MSIEDKIKELVAEQTCVEVSMVDNTSKFIDDLGADSLDVVEIIMLLEEEYNLDIEDSDAEKILTVQDAIDYITEHCEPDH